MWNIRNAEIEKQYAWARRSKKYKVSHLAGLKELYGVKPNDTECQHGFGSRDSINFTQNHKE